MYCIRNGVKDLSIIRVSLKLPKKVHSKSTREVVTASLNDVFCIFRSINPMIKMEENAELLEVQSMTHDARLKVNNSSCNPCAMFFTGADNDILSKIFESGNFE